MDCPIDTSREQWNILHATIWQKKGEYAISITFFCETYAHIDK